VSLVGEFETEGRDDARTLEVCCEELCGEAIGESVEAGGSKLRVDTGGDLEGDRGGVRG